MKDYYTKKTDALFLTQQSLLHQTDCYTSQHKIRFASAFHNAFLDSLPKLNPHP